MPSPSIMDIQSQPSIDEQLLSSIDNKARKAQLGFQSTFGPRSISFTILPLADFNLILMCSAIILDSIRFHTFYFTHQNISRVFSSLERRSMTPS